MDLALDTSRSPWACAYLDDVIVYSDSFEEHLKHLKDVFTKLRAAGLKLSPQKCQFCQAEVDYLGHTITPQGLKPINKTVKKIEQFPVPHDRKSLKSFLGLFGYYRRFIYTFASIAQPLHELLQHDTPFVWTATQQEAFDRLRNALAKDVPYWRSRDSTYLL